jgi:hypothetical protein
MPSKKRWERKWGVILVEGEMGSGKSNTVAGYIIDDYYKLLYGIKMPDGRNYRCRQCQYVDKGGKTVVDRDKVELTTVNSETGEIQGTGRVVGIPKGAVLLSTLKVFCVNMHLYGGLRYVYCKSVAELMRYCNSNLVSDGILVVDESYIAAEARRGMNPLSVLFTWFGQQIRKRHIKMYLIVQNRRFIEWRFRWMFIKRIQCKYNDHTCEVTLEITNLREDGVSMVNKKTVHYWGPQYWRYFDTDELPNIPERMIQKAAAWA